MESNAFLRKETHLPIFTITVFVMWLSIAAVASADWVLKPSPIVSEGREAPESVSQELVLLSMDRAQGETDFLTITIKIFNLV